MEEQIKQLEERIKRLEANQIGVIMTDNADQNVYRSMQRALLGNVNLGIGVASTDRNIPDATAILDLSSITRGFLPPRMTTSQRDLIIRPATGLVIYNTSTGVLNFYNGSVWGAV